MQSPSSMFRLEKWKKIIPLPLKLLSKKLVATSILILLKKRIFRNLEKLFAKLISKSDKKLSILYLRNYSIIQKSTSYLATKKKLPQYLLKSNCWYSNSNY